jgi:hypothetical protein
VAACGSDYSGELRPNQRRNDSSGSGDHSSPGA